MPTSKESDLNEAVLLYAERCLAEGAHVVKLGFAVSNGVECGNLLPAVKTVKYMGVSASCVQSRTTVKIAHFFRSVKER